MLLWQRMLVVIAVAAVPTAAMADQKSDCMKGVAMIKAQLKKKHPQPVREELQKWLGKVEEEVTESDWKECVEYVGEARKALRKK